MLLAKVAYSDEQRRAVAAAGGMTEARPLLRRFHDEALERLTPLLEELRTEGAVFEWGGSWRTGEVAVLAARAWRDTVMSRLRESDAVDEITIAPPLHGKGRRR